MPIANVNRSANKSANKFATKISIIIIYVINLYNNYNLGSGKYGEHPHAGFVQGKMCTYKFWDTVTAYRDCFTIFNTLL